MCFPYSSPGGCYPDDSDNEDCRYDGGQTRHNSAHSIPPQPVYQQPSYAQTMYQQQQYTSPQATSTSWYTQYNYSLPPPFNPAYTQK